MTKFIELMKKEHPEDVDECYDGGVCGCPDLYGYETQEESHKNCIGAGGKGCEYCWNREIPTDDTMSENLVEKDYDLFYKFIQSKGLVEDYERWLKRKLGGRYTEKPQVGDGYYFVLSCGEVECFAWDGDVSDEYRWLHMPLWKTEEDAERYLEVQNFIKIKARPFKNNESNWFLYINGLDDKNILIYSNEYMYNPNVDYFESKEDCKEIADAINKNDLLKYYFLIED